MFLAPLVPALLVVVVGYVTGYGVTALVDDLLGGALGPRAPEVVGWLTGLVLLWPRCGGCCAGADVHAIRSSPPSCGPPWRRR